MSPEYYKGTGHNLVIVKTSSKIMGVTAVLHQPHSGDWHFFFLTFSLCSSTFSVVFCLIFFFPPYFKMKGGGVSGAKIPAAGVGLRGARPSCQGVIEFDL